MYEISGRPKFDDRDEKILADRRAARDARPGPRVGVFLLLSGDDLRRFTHDWCDGLQTTWKGPDGSFYLNRNGGVYYSGSLDPAIPREQLQDTGETREGVFWFFHHDHSRAHNGVHCTMPCRMFRVVNRGVV